MIPAPLDPARASGIAAIFDVDGTLMRGSAERDFVRLLLRLGLIRPGAAFRFLRRAARALPKGYGDMVRANKYYLSGLPYEQVRSLAFRLYRERLASRIAQPAREALRCHRRKGHRVVLLSGMPEFLLEPFACHLGADLFIGCRLDVARGRLTGALAGPHPYGPNKKGILERLAASGAIDLGRSYGYGNHRSDRFFLESVGHAAAVHPDGALRKAAARRRWSIIDHWLPQPRGLGKESH